MKFRKEFVGLLLVVFVFAAHAISTNYNQTKRSLQKNEELKFHTSQEVEAMNSKMLGMLGGTGPIDPGEYFLYSKRCQGCHGHDSANYANLDYSGTDVNVFDDWAATMMSNSSKDPLWRAKVTHEILVNPSHSLELQDKCTSCHAPMGHYTSKFHGNLHYTLTDLYNDSLGLDGISCTGCHTIGSNGLGQMYSGEIPYDTNHIIYGPFMNPNVGPMQLYVGYTPTFSDHVSEGRMCSSCHTLLTNSVDLSGNLTGRQFVEQATYHEWVNSALSEDLITCQKCHMPQVTDSVVIANGYLNMPPRSPFNRHKFMGGNEFMLKLMKQNRERLKINHATDVNYDSTIAITDRNLKYQTLNMLLTADSITYDTAFFTVRLTNKVGHKFPSGYPSRRAVLQFVVVGSAGDTLFKSGLFDGNYEVQNINPSFEPHYNIITSASQHQIYEMVPGDVNGNKTTVLERMDTILKDNRLPPQGFVSTHPVYDTVRIVGNAFTDQDFNRTGTGTEGTGKDYVHYHIPINGYTGSFNAYTYVYYQSVPPGYLTEMFSHSTAEIDTFRVMYNSADKSPVLIVADSLLNMALGINTNGWEESIQVYPDPTEDGWVTLKVPDQYDLAGATIYDASGRKIQDISYQDINNAGKIYIPGASGQYYLEIWVDQRKCIKKIIKK